jgi:hypothetical protein
MPARRLQDRIKTLCERLLYEPEPDWSVTVRELQIALQDHMLRIANVSTALVVSGMTVDERRKPDQP